MIKDYRVTVKVRNNRILKAIEDVGGVSGAKWCNANGLSYVTVNELINMTASPLLLTGQLRTTAVKLCDVLNKLPEELWSNEQLYPLEKNFSEMEMDYAQVIATLPSAEQSYLLDDSAVEQRQQRQALDKAIATLRPKLQIILKYRFEENMSYAEIAETLDISNERVRQLESKALRAMRHPSRAACIIDCVDMPSAEVKRVKRIAARIEREDQKGGKCE